MNINENPDFKLNKDTPVVNQPTADEVSGATLKKDAPKNIFAKMTRAQAEEYDMLDAFILADTDESGDISEGEFIKYNETHQIGSGAEGITAYSSDTAEQTPEEQSEEIPVVEDPSAQVSEEATVYMMPVKEIPADGIKIHPSDDYEEDFHQKAEKEIAKSASTFIMVERMSNIHDFDKLQDIESEFISKLPESVTEAYYKAKSTNNKDDIGHFYTLLEEYKASKKKDGSVEQNLKAIASHQYKSEGRVLNEDELRECIDILSSSYGVHAGMTGDDVEEYLKIHPDSDILRRFNEICPEGKNVITEADITAYKIKQLDEKGYSYESLLKTERSTNDAAVKTSIRFALMDAGASSGGKVIEGFEINDFEGFLVQLNINKDEYNTLRTEEKAKLISDKFRELLQNDLSYTDKNSRFFKEVERLSRAEYNEDEIKNGYCGYMDSDAIEKLAKETIINEYQATIISLSGTAFQGQDDETIAAVTQSLIGSLDNFRNVRVDVAALGIHCMENGSEEQLSTIRAITKNEIKKDELDISSVSGERITEVILESADDETLTEFTEAFAVQIDHIQDIAASLSETLSDDRIQNRLQNVIAELVQKNPEFCEIIKTVNSDRSVSPNNNTKSNYGASGKIQPSYSGSSSVELSTASNTVTNPILDNRGYNIAELKELSNSYYSKSVNAGNNSSESSGFEAEINGLYAVYTPKGYAQSDVSTPPLVKLAEMCSKYNEMEEHQKTTFKNSLTRMKNSYQDMFCESYLRGDTALKTFLKREHLITDNDIFKHFDKKSSDLVYADKTLETKYYAYKSEQFKKVPEKQQDETFRLKSNWHDYS